MTGTGSPVWGSGNTLALPDNRPMPHDVIRIYLIEDDPTVLRFVEQTLLERPKWRLVGHSDTFSHARMLAPHSLADVYLIPQVESALRFKVDMGRWPLISAVDKACGELEAFRKAAPLAQPDAG